MKDLDKLITTINTSDFNLEFELDVIARSVASLNDSGRHQLIICTEELSELTQALCNHLCDRNDQLNLEEEIADVLVCLSYVKYIMNISDEELYLRDITAESYDQGIVETINTLASFAQSITKHLRGKGNKDIIKDNILSVISWLDWIYSNVGIDMSNVVKIRILKIRKLHSILEAGKK